jgi:hypothetical protein
LAFTGVGGLRFRFLGLGFYFRRHWAIVERGAVVEIGMVVEIGAVGLSKWAQLSNRAWLGCRNGRGCRNRRWARLEIGAGFFKQGWLAFERAVIFARGFLVLNGRWFEQPQVGVLGVVWEWALVDKVVEVMGAISGNRDGW